MRHVESSCRCYKHVCIALSCVVDFVKSILLSSVTRALRRSNLSSYYCGDTHDKQRGRGRRLNILIGLAVSLPSIKRSSHESGDYRPRGRVTPVAFICLERATVETVASFFQLAISTIDTLNHKIKDSLWNVYNIFIGVDDFHLFVHQHKWKNSRK